MPRKFPCLFLFLALLSALTAPARAGEKWAVIVGINNYGENIPHLRFAVADAKRLYAMMLKSAPPDHIALLVTDGSGIAPTGQNVAQAAARFAKQAKPDDEFWFCFSGHGEDQNGIHYLLPSDAKISDYKNTAINLKDLRDSLAVNCAARKKMLVIDACHSGWDDMGENGRRGAASPLPTLWASCSAKESSWEIPELGEGVFTWFFLKKQEEIGANGLQIPSSDAASEVNTHVATYILRNKKPFTQTPQVIGSLPKGGLIQIDTPPDPTHTNPPVNTNPPLSPTTAMPDPPGDVAARDPLGPAILVELPDVRSQLDGRTIKSEIAQAALRKALLAKNFPLVDVQAARRLETILNRSTAAKKAKTLGARYLIRGTAETSATKMAITRDFITVQVTITAELIDETGTVIAQAVVGSTQDEPVVGTDVTEIGAAKMALEEAAKKLTDALLPSLRSALAQRQNQR